MSSESTKESPRQRLERLRLEVASLPDEQPVEAASAPAPLRLPTPGETIHALESGLTIATGLGWLAGGAVLARGQNLVVTSQLLEANRDALGRYNGPGLVHHPDEQMAVHGRLLFAPGPAPDDMTAEPGTAEWREQREQARTDAWLEPDTARRAAALAEVERKYGVAPTTSTHWKVEDPSIKQAEAQRAELDAGGVRLRSHYEAQEPGVRR